MAIATIVDIKITLCFVCILYKTVSYLIKNIIFKKKNIDRKKTIIFNQNMLKPIVDQVWTIIDFFLP